MLPAAKIGQQLCRRLQHAGRAQEVGDSACGGVPLAWVPVGEVSEWLKEPHSKCGLRVTVAGVRIPPSPFHIHQYHECPDRVGRRSVVLAIGVTRVGSARRGLGGEGVTLRATLRYTARR